MPSVPLPAEPVFRLPLPVLGGLVACCVALLAVRTRPHPPARDVPTVASPVTITRPRVSSRNGAIGSREP